MKRLHSTLLCSALCVMLLPLAALAAPTGIPGPRLAAQSQVNNRLEFHDAMRKLWEDHATWTRLYIVSDIQELPDVTANAERLLQNQADIGSAIAPFYGAAAGDQLTALLTDHILIAVAVIDAVQANDSAAIAQELERWYANADDIAELLHSVNPRNWPLEELQAMLDEHLDLTTAEVLSYFAGDYPASVADYEAVHLAILEMADMLSSGIIRQFPQAFSPGRSR